MLNSNVLNDSEFVQILKDLTIDPDELSSKKRKVISAKDSRASSTGIGAVGIVFIALIFSILVLFDLTRTCRHHSLCKDNA